MPLPGLRREFDLWLQNRLTWSAPVWKRRLTSLADLEATLPPPALARYRELAARYPLARWPQVCNRREAQLNLYVLDLLDRHARRSAPGARLLDIGSGRWSYLPALASFAGERWDGVEIDAHRRDWTLVTRRGYAGFMRRIAPGCRYLAGSLLDVRGIYGGITWFLPFVTPGPLAAARLPARMLQPRALLAHAWQRLADGGWMLVVNQGEEERAAQQVLFGECGIDARALGEMESVFSPFHERRFGWLAVKGSQSCV